MNGTIIDYSAASAYISAMKAKSIATGLSSAGENPALDRLVLTTVNAPYKRDIDAAALSECLARAELGEWPVHLASFFTEVDPKLVLAFAASHGISGVALAKAYAAMKGATGERNPELERELVPLATAAP